MVKKIIMQTYLWVLLLLLLVLLCAFKRWKALQYVIAVLVLSLFLLLYVFIPFKNPWQIFIVCVPAVGIVFLACNVKKRPSLKTLKEKLPHGVKKPPESAAETE